MFFQPNIAYNSTKQTESVVPLFFNYDKQRLWQKRKHEEAVIIDGTPKVVSLLLKLCLKSTSSPRSADKLDLKNLSVQIDFEKGS